MVFPDAYLAVQFDGRESIPSDLAISELLDSCKVSAAPHGVNGSGILDGFSMVELEIKAFKQVQNKSKADYVWKIDSDTLCFNRRFVDLAEQDRFALIGTSSTIPGKEPYSFARGSIYGLHRRAIEKLPTSKPLKKAVKALEHKYGPRFKKKCVVEDEAISLLVTSTWDRYRHIYLHDDTTGHGSLLGYWHYRNHPNGVSSKGATELSSLYDFGEFGRRSQIQPAPKTEKAKREIAAETMRDVIRMRHVKYSWFAREGRGDSIEFREGLAWPSYDEWIWKLRHEIEALEIIIPLCKGRGVAIQAGGACGLWAKRLAKDFDRVLTFEPDPLNYQCLSINCVEPNIYRHNIALDASNGTAGLANPYVNNCGSHQLTGTGEIETIAIDSFLPDCDLICLDIEGSELRAVRGAKETIARCKPVVVLEQREHGESPSEFMGSLGYELRQVIGYDHVWTPIEPQRDHITQAEHGA